MSFFSVVDSSFGFVYVRLVFLFWGGVVEYERRWHDILYFLFISAICLVPHPLPGTFSFHFFDTSSTAMTVSGHKYKGPIMVATKDEISNSGGN
jgi:hypothetical protein